MEIRPVGAELFHAGRQTDSKTRRTKNRISQFWERA